VRFNLPSLVVTLATLIAYRGLARVLVEDRGLGDFPDWFDRLGTAAPPRALLPLAMLIFVGLAVIAWVILQRTPSAERSPSSALTVLWPSIRASRSAREGRLFVASSRSPRCGAPLAARRRACAATWRWVRARHHHHRLLGGVSIFGGVGSITARVAILIVLSLRNGMALADLTAHPVRILGS
jgi:rhamnose transport system permease protein